MKHFLAGALIAVSLTACGKPENTSATFFNALQEHYRFSQNYTKFSVTYKSAFDNAYQAYDYNHPVAGITTGTVEFDTKKNVYSDQSKTRWPGGFVFDLVEFQNTSISRQYDVNGMLFQSNRMNKLAGDK